MLMRSRRYSAASLLLLVTMILLACAPVDAAASARSSVADLRAAMRMADFEAAVEMADACLAAGLDPVDEVLYLKALALHHSSDYDESIATADRLLADHADSPWIRKAGFLKAQSLLKQRRYREAEEIYEAEAFRLLSSARKEELAGVLVRFADELATEPDPLDPGAPPANYGKAYSLYVRALAMEIPRDLRDAVRYKLGLTAMKASNPAQAVIHFREYLDEFDPDWTGPVGSPRRMRGEMRENPPPAGDHIHDTRFQLGRALMMTGDYAGARQNLEDLRTMLATPDAEKALGSRLDELQADTGWEIVRTYNLPHPNTPFEKAIKAARDFLERHPSHPRSIQTAWLIADAHQQYGRLDDAVEAFRRFIDGADYDLPDGDEATTALVDLGHSPLELEGLWQPEAHFRIGQIRFQQRRFDEAIEWWQRYVNRFPNGPQWATSQRQIIDAQFMIALEVVSEGDVDKARELFSRFLAQHPLDARAPQVQFILGQMHASKADELFASCGVDRLGSNVRPDEPEKLTTARREYLSAIREWSKLIAKYPNTEESSLALFRTGLIQELKLGELETALESYRRLTWGSWYAHAQQRIAQMTQKQFRLETDRKFRTHETPFVTLSARNVKKVTVRRYDLDPEAYYRKTHTTGGVEALDIALIEPDGVWEVEIDDYAKYTPIEQQIEIPMDADHPGVCVVNVADDDLEATTLIIRSDLDLALRSSRRELLVYVQDMVGTKPASGVDVLVSDGSKIIATGRTGADGVLRKTLDELQSVENLGVFASRKGHVASNLVSLSGLQTSQGLARRGYIYTDRPAYQPGQVVSVRGVIRDVVDGSYHVPDKREYVVGVTDPQGRLLREERLVLSDYGSFNTSFSLGDAASVGAYMITAREDRQNGHVYSAGFTVQQFQLPKMQLTFDFGRTVYFRGETVEATLTAQYYWGQPVVGASVRYTLPDGRSFVATTGDDGALPITFDTTGISAGQRLRFAASIEGEDVHASGDVFLPALGFTLKASPSQTLVVAGEPFEVDVTATAPDGAPVARDITLLVLRRAIVKPDPVLSQVPWISPPHEPAGEVTVEEHAVTTDEKTGRATVRLTLDEGGIYILRAAGDDRFGQTVVAQNEITISDDDDATKLRIFADADTLEVGERASLRLHSRLDKGLALLTWEGETIIGHRIVEIGGGYTPVELNIGHEHFPNFALSALVLDGRELRTARREFTVRRQLHVAVKPAAEIAAPGSETEVELVVTDQLGKPVQAELSLALVDEALFALFPDTTPEIVGFFETGARRFAEFRVAATNGFAYVAQTRGVVKAILAEEQRLVTKAAEAEALEAVREDLADYRAAGRVAGERSRFAANAPMPAAQSEMDGDPNTLGRKMHPWQQGKSILADDEASAEQPRTIRRDAGWWSPAIVTDTAGRAVVTVPMPESTSRWRLTARGVTVDTLVGQATSEIVTRKDFFVELKLPRSLLEGDELSVLGRVHNLTGFQGPAELTLTVTSADKRFGQQQRTVSVDAETTSEFLFERVTVPAVGELELTVTARAGDRRDAVRRSVPVRPWGLPYAAHGGGTSTTHAAVRLELPRGLEFTSRWMTIAIGPSVEQSIIDMAMGAGRGPRPLPHDGRLAGPVHPAVHFAPEPSMGSELLAALSGLEYASAAKASEVDRRRLWDRTTSLVSGLVMTQRDDGGWGWSRGAGSDWWESSINFWALSGARRHGLSVHDDTLRRAEGYLLNAFQSAGASDHTAKAVILHALSTGGAAKFELANSLYRERNTLDALALACTALTLANLDRDEVAGEVLETLDRRAAETRSGRRVLASWTDKGDQYPWLRDEILTTSMALLALLEVAPSSPRVEQAVQYLLDRRGCFEFPTGQGRGAAVRALSRYFARGQFAEDDFRLTVYVNDEPVHTIERRRGGDPIVIDVPAPLLARGANDVRFELEGRGTYTYAATLRGFSPQFVDPQSWRSPYVRSRLYQHAPLTYRDRPINAVSTSPVENVEIGQRVIVRVDMHNRSYHGYLVVEEPLPAGTTLVPGSLTGNFAHHEVRDGTLVMFVPRGQTVSDYSYELVGYATGAYRVLPTVIRDANDASRMRIGSPDDLVVLAPGQESDDPYEMNDAERYALGSAYFADGRYAEALGYLWPLFDRDHKYNERDVARMLLWIHTSDDYFDATRVVQTFEVLTVRHPELTIPFDKILVVGQAYRDLGEYERAWIVFRATIDSSFLSDSNLSAILEDEGQLLASIDYQESLWWEYPDTAEVASSYFALSQMLYENATKAPQLAAATRSIPIAVPGRGDRWGGEEPTRIEMIAAAIRLLSDFMALYPTSPLGDDAGFSMANAYLDLQDYDAVVELSRDFRRHFRTSEFTSSFQYMVALGHFWKRDYEPALDAARVVADGESKDRDFARYILGQIYHAQEKPGEAMSWYRKVDGLYPDAREAIEYFEKKRIALDEVEIFRPGEDVELRIDYRNIREVHLQVYKVDLMKLYLREKNLSKITEVNLAGIEPQLVKKLDLGNGRDYVDKEALIDLDVEDEGAYLVICRGDDLFTSGLVLITPLKIEVQEDAISGRVRVNLIDEVEDLRPAGVHVKAIGSADSEFRSGETDLRGIFVADAIRGTVTAIARDAESRYAFYRGDDWLGAPTDVPQTATPLRTAPGGPVDYQDNLRIQNEMMQRSYNAGWDQMRRQDSKGVQVDKAR